MNVRMWGTRGSVPTPGAATQRYGGNTSCIEVGTTRPEQVVALDAGTGIRGLGAALAPSVERVDVLLTHLHMDHIIGLGFFGALFRSELEVHLWGPSSTKLTLRERLARYLSPPLFPVRLRDLPCRLTLHDVPLGTFDLPTMQVTAALVTHPGPTVGYRLEDDTGSLAYLPDHEPALGVRDFPESRRWTSGYDVAAGVSLLVHDAQYTSQEYRDHVGWGHSAIDHTLAFAELTGARHLLGFHHDPSHDDGDLDAVWATAAQRANGFELSVAREGACIDVGTP